MKVYVPSSNSWRDVPRAYVYNATLGAWKLVQRAYSYVQNVGWRLVFARVPGQVGAVLYSAPANSNETVSFVGQADWNPPSGDDTGLPVLVRFYKNGVRQETQVNPVAPASYNFSINTGETVTTYATVSILNGTYLAENNYEGAEGTPLASDTRSTQYYIPAVNMSTITLNTSNDNVTLSWTPTNGPSGAWYRVYWSVFISSSGQTTAETMDVTQSTSLVVSAVQHGWDLLPSNFGATTNVQFYGRVEMYTADNGTLLASSSTIASDSCPAKPFLD